MNLDPRAWFQPIDEQQGKHVTPAAIYVVLMARIFPIYVVGMVITGGIGRFLLGWRMLPVLGWPVMPLTFPEFFLYTPIFAAVALIIIPVVHYPMVIVSWSVAWVLCPSVRRQWREMDEV